MFIIISAYSGIYLNALGFVFVCFFFVRAQKSESMHAHSHTYGYCPRNMIQRVTHEDMCIFSFLK